VSHAPATLTSLNLAGPDEVRTGAWTGSVGRTGIAKRPVAGAVRTGADQLDGDTICDTRNHGGPDQAVYAYAGEDAAWWSVRLDRPLPPGMFGENLTTRGVDVTDAVIGERWTIGTAVFEVRRPRIPCRVFAGYWEEPRLVKTFTRAGRPGAYLRIVVPGELRAGDPIRVGDVPGHGVTIAETFRALTGARELAGRVLTAEQLPEPIRAKLRRLAG
jgi:MOSC domain-containing protein YiiM